MAELDPFSDTAYFIKRLDLTLRRRLPLTNEQIEQEEAEAEIKKNIEEGFLERIFPKEMPTDLPDLREYAVKFKEFFDGWKTDQLTLLQPPGRKRVVEQITLASLSCAAAQKLDEFGRKKGSTIPNSWAEQAADHDARRWNIIDQVVKAASEIRGWQP